MGARSRRDCHRGGARLVTAGRDPPALGAQRWRDRGRSGSRGRRSVGHSSGPARPRASSGRPDRLDGRRRGPRRVARNRRCARARSGGCRLTRRVERDRHVSAPAPGSCHLRSRRRGCAGARPGATPPRARLAPGCRVGAPGGAVSRAQPRACRSGGDLPRGERRARPLRAGLPRNARAGKRGQGRLRRPARLRDPGGSLAHEAGAASRRSPAGPVPLARSRYRGRAPHSPERKRRRLRRVQPVHAPRPPHGLATGATRLARRLRRPLVPRPTHANTARRQHRHARTACSGRRDGAGPAGLGRRRRRLAAGGCPHTKRALPPPRPRGDERSAGSRVASRASSGGARGQGRRACDRACRS